MRVRIQAGRWGKDIGRAAWARWVERIVTTAGRPDSTVVIRLAGDDELRRLNRRFRHLDRPTDILSFPADRDSSDHEGCMGDIVISADTAARQAAEDKVPLLFRLVELSAHGVIHLAGPDHHGRRRAEWNRMEKRLKKVLEAARREICGPDLAHRDRSE